MIEAQAQQQLDSIDSVAQELTKGTDKLADWCRDRKRDGWFLSVDDEETQQRFAELAAWVMTLPFKPSAKQEFLAGADPWLIAKARSLGATVVTHEKLDPACKRKILIPNVCRHYGIPYLDTFAMMKQCSVKFTLR